MSTTKQQQVIALARLGWSLRRIEAETGVRRGTASKYARVAGLAVRPPGGWGHGPPKPDACAVDMPSYQFVKRYLRRQERSSTILTSNRPIDDWGKMLGDTAAVTAMLDRVLHHCTTGTSSSAGRACRMRTPHASCAFGRF